MKIKPEASLGSPRIAITLNKDPEIQLLIIYQGGNKILGIGELDPTYFFLLGLLYFYYCPPLTPYKLVP